MNIDIDRISKQVKEKGCDCVNNLISDTNFKKVEQFLKFYKKTKGGEDRSFPVSKKNYLIKLLKLDFSAIKKGLFLKKISKEYKLQEIANKVLRGKTKLVDIDAYISPKSDSNVIDWHCDYAYSGDPQPKKILNPNLRSIKFFIYLTDVEYKNGSFAYIPFSHKIQKAYSELLLEKKIQYKPFWKLKDFRDQILLEPLKTMIITKVSKQLYENFLSSTSFIEEKNGDTNKYDFEMKKGGTVIFDELGFHRGSAPTLNNRLVLRFFYKFL